ncbi:MAG: trimeric autotransporter adhesin, partial [Acidobacteriota bacterium]|nr:trimeric autotransporter adhesin [Acidobacteriota bacterium]
MKKRLTFLMAIISMFLMVTFWITAEEVGNNPVAVSPGSETDVVTVWQSCPTFSWSFVDQAASYRIAVFESMDRKVTTYEGMTIMSSPVINKQISGPALSWTLSSEESLKTGSMYVWYVQAMDSYGNVMGNWSNGRIFKVEQEVRFAGIEEKLGEILKSYGVSEETTTNVLKDMKSVVKEVVVRDGGIKNTPGVSGVQGYEGDLNTFYGLNAGASNTSGNFNSFLGKAAGYSNTTGYENTFIGHRAGYWNNTGYYNTFIGASAGIFNTTGCANTFLGNYAGDYNSTGSYNTFLG